MNFYRRVELVAGEIPFGKVSSYGQLALLCGMPGYARQVGYALSHGLLGLQVPAHRIVNNRGVLSGAAAFDKPDTQSLLLKAEGVDFLEDNRVNMRLCCWKTTLEQALAYQKNFIKMEI